MNDKKNIIPILIASAIALVITAIVRILIPSSSSNNSINSSKELSMPDIPLMVKKIEKKKAEYQVLVVTKNIKKDEKIKLESTSWKKWPQDAMQTHFIAKDEKGTPLNNSQDYNNALKMWANNEIPSGAPLTISMLTNEDPIKKAEIEKKKKQQELLKKQAQEKSNSLIRKGMRAVTFSIDQKSASSSNMISPGDLVDVLIMEQRGDKSRTHKYKAIKILAIDGVTKFESKKESNSGLLGSVNLASVGGLLSPKNVTLEVKENMVEIMLQQAGNTGIILSLRSQTEKIEDDESSGSSENSEEERRNSVILQTILDSGRSSASGSMLESANNKENEERKVSSLISAMNSVNKETANNSLISKKNNKDDLSMLMNTIVSVGTDNARQSILKKNNENLDLSLLVSKMNSIADNTSANWKNGDSRGKNKSKEESEKTITIYRKLTADGVKFDENGEKITDKNNSLDSNEVLTSSGSPSIGNSVEKQK